MAGLGTPDLQARLASLRKLWGLARRGLAPLGVFEVLEEGTETARRLLESGVTPTSSWAATRVNRPLHDYMTSVWLVSFALLVPGLERQTLALTRDMHQLAAKNPALHALAHQEVYGLRELARTIGGERSGVVSYIGTRVSDLFDEGDWVTREVALKTAIILRTRGLESTQTRDVIHRAAAGEDIPPIVALAAHARDVHADQISDVAISDFETIVNTVPSDLKNAHLIRGAGECNTVLEAARRMWEGPEVLGPTQSREMVAGAMALLRAKSSDEWTDRLVTAVGREFRSTLDFLHGGRPQPPEFSTWMVNQATESTVKRCWLKQAALDRDRRHDASASISRVA